MNNNLIKLAKEHSDHLIGDADDQVFHRDNISSHFLKEAEKIYEAINSGIGKKDGMYKTSKGYDKIETGSNALMGAFCVLLGKREEADEIYRGIRKKIWRSGLYASAEHKVQEYTGDNAAMGIFCQLLGRREEADNINFNIKEDVEKSGDLYMNGTDLVTVYPYSNALMGAFEKMMGNGEESEKLYNSINSVFGKDDCLYTHSIEYGKEPRGHENAAMAVLCELLGRSEEAEDIIKGYEAFAGGEGKLVYDGKSFQYPSTEVNALIGIYNCLKAGVI